MTSSNLHHPGHPVSVPAVAGARFEDTYVAQEQTYWCWAACAEMVMRQLQLEPVLPQCQIASKRFGIDCCAAPGPCNRPHPMAEIKRLYEEHLGVTCHGIEGPIKESLLMDEVLADRPVQIGYTYATAQVGHVVVVIGEHNRRRTGMKYLRVADPREKYGRQSILFEDVRTDSGKGVWSWTWIGMRKMSAG